MKKIITSIIIFFIFISSPKALDLTISNNQNDYQTNTYTYELNIYNATGAYEYNYNNKTAYLIFDAAGNTTFTLQSNETIIIKNIPESSYQIKQSLHNNYNTYINNKQTNIYNSNTKTNNKITFVNKVKQSKNPNTSTLPIALLILTIITTFTLIFLKRTKIKRYI